MNKVILPLIKENRISKLTDILNIFDKYPYNRENQSESILKLYPNKIAKSVFRGMAIPSLRYLGLIVGYDNLIRISANGKIIIEAYSKSDEELFRAWRAIIYELDNNSFGFIRVIRKRSDLYKIRNELAHSIKGPSEKQVIERINRWLRILCDSRLIIEEDGQISLNYKTLERAIDDTNANDKKRLFKQLLFEGYKTFSYRDTAGIIDIAELRESVSILFYSKYKKILTEHQFDKLLSTFPLISKKYIISLGHTMGAEEKLFKLKGECYRTLSINILD
jgi:hypothetical protein